MIDRVIDLSDEPAHLKVHLDNLLIRRDNQPDMRLPLSEIAVLVASHPQITYTHAVLSGLASAGAVLVVCDKKRLPAAMQVPLQTHYIQGERFAQQAAAPLPTKKRLWQQLVRAKIKAQARLLEKLHGSDFGLPRLVPQVKSGDPTNMEGRAARTYWRRLFNNPNFRRDTCADDQNRLLNYGYAVLRAVITRAVCAAGLHPSLGLHHHNRYDPFPLASDLMEPFRPLVDRAVTHIVKTKGPDAPLDRETKQVLLRALTQKFTLNGEARSLFDVAFRCAASLAAAFSRSRKSLLLPEIPL